MPASPTTPRAAGSAGFLTASHITPERVKLANALNEIAKAREQKLGQMALAWVLRHAQMTSVLIGASRESQVHDAVGALARLDFSAQELATIDALLKETPRD